MPMLKIFISEKFLNKCLNFIYFKVANDWNVINYDISFQWLICYGFFLTALMYTSSFLPYGRFYNKIGGNFWLLISYFYIFSFLTFMFLRNSWVLNNLKYNTVNY